MDSLGLAKKLRGWQQEHPKTDFALGFVPGVGQAYGLASSAAAMRDPEASNLEKGLAAASVLPIGKAAGALRKIVVGEKTIKGHTGLEAALAEAKKLALKIRKAEASSDPSKGAAGISDLVRGDPRVNDRLLKETGFFYDPDSARFMTELDDSKSFPDYEFLDQAVQNKMLGPNTSISLGDAMVHPELQKLPEGKKMLGEIGVQHDPAELGRGGEYSISQDTVRFGSPIEPDPRHMRDARDTLLHETQHAIAQREGFKQGTNPEAAGSYEAYLQNPGEMLARVASLRRNMTPEARRKYPFHRHMDDERYRLMDPLQQRRYANEEDLKRSLKLRNLDPEEMIVPGP